MGMCSQPKNSQISKEIQVQSEIISNEFPSLTNKSTTSFYLLNQLVEIKSLMEPKEYDYSNPHRQYNVIIEGVLFDVVNSREASLEFLD